MKKTVLLPALLLRAADDNLSAPVGYFRTTFAAGTGTARKVTAYAPPLGFVASTITGAATGAITSRTAGTVTVSGAGWAVDQFRNPATPFLLKLTSGAATGRMLVISTSEPGTTDTLTLDPNQTDPLTLGVAADDTFELYRCDTLASLFGTPATTGILGGATAATADNIVLIADGVTRTYYYNTTLSRWTLDAAGSPDASDTPLLPDRGLLYGRLDASPLELIVTGRVAETARSTDIKKSGATLLAQNWPADLTLATSGIASLPGWVSAIAVASADKVKLYVNGTLYTYWHDGTNWRRQTLGSPISNTVVLPAGSALTLEKVGTASGRTPLTQALPYSLN